MGILNTICASFMKLKYLYLLILISSFTTFADNKIFDGEDVSGKTFYGSFIDSSWVNTTAVDTLFCNSNFTNANFTGANLILADFYQATLSTANFTNATIIFCQFSNVTSGGFTKEQFYTTASYKDKNLTGIELRENNLSSWDFTDQVITAVDFSYTTGFTKEQLYSTASYKNKKLFGTEFGYINLSGWDFTDQIIIGCDFRGTISNGFTKEQFYSTKSYKNKDLRLVSLAENSLSGWNFSGQDLKYADLSNTDLTNADFTKADLRGADMRGIVGTYIAKNTLMSDGVVKNFYMASTADNFSISKFTLLSEGILEYAPELLDMLKEHPELGDLKIFSPTGDRISAKIAEADAVIYGGAQLSLESGAQLDITNNKTLTVASDGNLLIETDINESGLVSVASGSGLNFENGGKLLIDVRGDLSQNDIYNFIIIDWEEGAQITGLSEFVKGETLLLSLNGEKYKGLWEYSVQNNQFMINMGQIPEPATYAIIFGIGAFCFSFCHRKMKR